MLWNWKSPKHSMELVVLQTCSHLDFQEDFWGFPPAQGRVLVFGLTLLSKPPFFSGALDSVIFLLVDGRHYLK